LAALLTGARTSLFANPQRPADLCAGSSAAKQVNASPPAYQRSRSVLLTLPESAARRLLIAPGDSPSAGQRLQEHTAFGGLKQCLPPPGSANKCSAWPRGVALLYRDSTTRKKVAFKDARVAPVFSKRRKSGSSIPAETRSHPAEVGELFVSRPLHRFAATSGAPGTQTEKRFHFRRLLSNRRCRGGARFIGENLVYRRKDQGSDQSEVVERKIKRRGNRKRI